MPDSDAHRIKARRIVLALGALLAFVVVARLAQPGSSRATEPGTQAPAHAVIGTLVGPQYHVRITAGIEDPRYTVMTPEGEVLEQDLLAHEVYHFFPDLDVTKLRFGAEDAMGGPVMLAEPE